MQIYIRNILEYLQRLCSLLAMPEESKGENNDS